MIIKDLKQAIKDLPDDMSIYIGERLTEYEYGLVNGFSVKEIYNVENGLNEVVFTLTEE